MQHTPAIAHTNHVCRHTQMGILLLIGDSAAVAMECHCSMLMLNPEPENQRQATSTHACPWTVPGPRPCLRPACLRCTFASLPYC